MRSALTSSLVLFAALAVAGCTTAGASPSASPAASVPPSATASSTAPSPSADACAKDSLTTMAAGKLTVGTDNPAYPPYFQIPEGTATAPWELGDPTNGEGFESAFAYALADTLGFGEADVAWVVVPFDNAIAPGAKTFDINVNQVSFKPERAEAVDLSDGYYTINQSIVALKDNGVASAKTVADLKAFKFGAQTGTTSLDTINDVIAPTAAAQVYNTNDDAIAGLQAKQIDGLVADLGTTFFIRNAELTDGVIVGELPTVGEQEHFSAVLNKGSPLTACVNQAIAAIKADGSLDAARQKYVTSEGAPKLQ